MPDLDPGLVFNFFTVVADFDALVTRVTAQQMSGLVLNGNHINAPSIELMDASSFMSPACSVGPLPLGLACLLFFENEPGSPGVVLDLYPILLLNLSR